MMPKTFFPSRVWKGTPHVRSSSAPVGRANFPGMQTPFPCGLPTWKNASIPSLFSFCSMGFQLACGEFTDPDNDLYGLFHALQGNILILAMEIVATGKDVRAGQAHKTKL